MPIQSLLKNIINLITEKMRGLQPVKMHLNDLS